MWLSVRFHPIAYKYTPYLNGQKLEHCFAANEEECWADVYALPYNVWRNRQGEKFIPWIRLKGHVELIPPKI